RPAPSLPSTKPRLPQRRGRAIEAHRKRRKPFPAVRVTSPGIRTTCRFPEKFLNRICKCGGTSHKPPSEMNGCLVQTGQPGKPAPHVRGRGNLPCGAGQMLSHRYSEPAELWQRGHGILIGDVVAEEDRPAPGEGRMFHQVG